MVVLQPGMLRTLKRKGFADSRLAGLLNVSEDFVRQQRLKAGIRPVFKRVDSCAAEFVSSTAYLYSTYEEECEAGSFYFVIVMEQASKVVRPGFLPA